MPCVTIHQVPLASCYVMADDSTRSDEHIMFFRPSVWLAAFYGPLISWKDHPSGICPWANFDVLERYGYKKGWARMLYKLVEVCVVFSLHWLLLSRSGCHRSGFVNVQSVL